MTQARRKFLSLAAAMSGLLFEAEVRAANVPGSRLRIVTDPRPIGGTARNQPCPCGCGRKAKHCARTARAA